MYHITVRGNDRQAIFEDDADCSRFLIVLASVVARYRVCCHAYCLMGNHYHLRLETPEGNLSNAMRPLNGVYTQRFLPPHRPESGARGPGVPPGRMVSRALAHADGLPSR
jgi:putative transposase